MGRKWRHIPHSVCLVFQFVRDQFESFGLDASIEPVRTMLSYPSERKAPSLKLLRKADRSVVFEAGGSLLQNSMGCRIWSRDSSLRLPL